MRDHPTNRLRRHGSRGVPPRRSSDRRLDCGLPRAPRAVPGALPREAGRRSGSALPARGARGGRALRRIFEDFERIIVPGITHWNHPGFFAYFAITGSGPGVLAEFLSAALNAQGMLWRTSPSVTELEEVALGWLRQLIGLPPAFEGVIYDTASISSLHALAAAREAVVAGRARAWAWRTARACRACASTAPSTRTRRSTRPSSCSASATKRSGRSRPTTQFRMRPDALARGHRRGPRGGTSAARGRGHGRHDVDDERRSGAGDRRHLPERRVCGCTSMRRTPASRRWSPNTATFSSGCDRADSLVVNPHKWLFTPFDLSAFYCRRMDVAPAGVLADAGVPEDAWRRRRCGT